MMMSIMGMYEYDQSLFDGLDVPSYTDSDNNIYIIDKDDLINNILLECAELELIYPSAEIMKLAIGVWSTAEQDTWKKLYVTQKIEYNPIWNVDADIQESITGSEIRDIDRNGSGSNNRTLNLTDATTINETDTRSVKGFNSEQWAEAEKNVRSGNDSIQHTGTDNIQLTNTDSVNDELNTINNRNERRTGNIGVTATQDLIKKEREIADFNIIKFITESFKYRFCLLVY